MRSDTELASAGRSSHSWLARLGGPGLFVQKTVVHGGTGDCRQLIGGCGGGGGEGDTAGPPKTPATPGSAATEAPTTEAPTPTLIIDPTPEGDLSGVWSGTWTSTNPEDGSTGTFKIQWAHAGSALSRTITVNGTPCLTTGAITGTLAGDAIEFGSIQGQFDVDFSGTVAGETMSGTYSTSCGPAEGDWEAAETA